MGIEQFLGVGFKLTTSENFDEYMKELGVNIINRKIAANLSVTVTLTEEGGVYTLTSTSTFKNSVISFKLGEEFDEETVDGRKVKTTITVDGNKLIQEQKGDINTSTIREYNGDAMVATMKVNNVVCTRNYAKV